MESKNRRGAFRVKGLRPVSVRVSGQTGIFMVADMSLSGGLVVGMDLPEGTPMAMWIDPEDGREKIRIRAVVRRRVEYEGYPSVGVSFDTSLLSFASEDRVSRYLRMLERTALAQRKKEKEEAHESTES